MYVCTVCTHSVYVCACTSKCTCTFTYMCVCVGGGGFCLPDCQDLLDFLLSVRLCGDDQQPVQQVNRDTVRTSIVGATDPAGENKG